MDKKTFGKLVSKYLDGKATAAEKALLDEWYDRFEEEPDQPMTPEKLQQTETELFSGIQARKAKSSVRLLPWLRIAAMWLMLAASGAVIYIKRHAIQDFIDPVQQLALTAGKGELKKLQLPDGSVVWLNSGSTLHFPKTFRHSKREVKLTGEAYFDIKQQPDMPFVVYAGDVKTEVLGTSFNISSYQSLADVKVAVTSGKVAVSAAKSSKMTLQPNQQAIFNKQTSSLHKEDMDANAAAGWMKGDYSFRDATLSEIALALENRFKVTIKMTGATLPAKRMNAGFSAEDSLAIVLENLRETAGLNYRFNKPDEILFY